MTTTIPSTINTNNSISECIVPNNITRRSSIIYSKTNIYFEVNEGENITSEETLDAFNNLKLIITLYTRCRGASSKQSTFNATLSQIEQTIEVNIDPEFLISQSSISTELQYALSTAPQPPNDLFVPEGTTENTCTTYMMDGFYQDN